jgi:long-chain fatty acid transport protein
MRRYLVAAGMAAATSLASAPALQAQGSAVYTQSACMSARNGAGVAAPCADGSAVFYNPAALATLPGALGLGVTMIRTENTFTYDHTGEVVRRGPATTPVPHVYATRRFGDRFGAGIGVWAPYGLGIDWPETFEGRYVSYETSLRNVFIQPTVAYDAIPGRLALGGGIALVRGSIEINQRLDLATQQAQPGVTFGMLGIPSGTDFADVRLEGAGTGVTGQVGALVQLLPNLSLGARYLHSTRITFDEGTATFTAVPTGLVVAPGSPLHPAPQSGEPVPMDALVAGQFTEGALRDQRVRTEIELPPHAVIGLALQATPALRLMADYQWYGWSTFDEFPLAFEHLPESSLLLDYEDAHVFRFGGEFAVSPALLLRGGFTYNTPAAPDETVTPLLPEGERNYFSAGLGYRVTPNLGVDLFYMTLTQADRRGRVRGRDTRAQTADQLNVGLYTANAHLLGATLSWQFGGVR